MATRHGTRVGEGGAVTRLLHATLAIAFLGAWLSAEWEGLRTWHIACGHALAGALLARIAWSLARPRASLLRWWHTFRRAARRLRSGHDGVLRAPTWTIAGSALVVCGIVLLVPGCFVTGWALGRLVDVAQEPVALHRWLGTTLMVVVATHVALVAVLGVLRGPRMARDVLPGGPRSGQG
ncbi:cytochrome b/b6 domain-containing protein [Aquabacterium sp. UBA2148]|uniref:cytochrome b/b6 domain-containing protein n=1 Tax=Aquabacterium sp. UBA2148 TaxID=1946042 RepID=UPI00257EFC49|nr:cytochrome b/b6 domain-containing protein [Aquabacterium sp. UBA2148]